MHSDPLTANCTTFRIYMIEILKKNVWSSMKQFKMIIIIISLTFLTVCFQLRHFEPLFLLYKHRKISR